MSQAVISVKENTREEDIVKMFEEILKEKLDEIFKQQSSFPSHSFILTKNEVPLSCRLPLNGRVVWPGSHS